MGVVVAQVKKIVSFGDSFIFGSELKNNEHGHKAWPGLIAADLGLDYETMAVPGCGNEAIAQQIFTYFSSCSTKDTLAIINWTWCMRWDFYLASVKEYIALGPTCVPDKLKDKLEQGQATELINFYNTYVANSHQWNQFRSLTAILATQSFLKMHNIKNLQTYMDRELFMPPVAPSRLEHYLAFKDVSWPDITKESQLDTLPEQIKIELDQNYNSMSEPDYIQILQKMVWSEMHDFDGQTFLEWSHSCGYQVTPPPGDHPLEKAHSAAADLWKEQYRKLIQ
jgi:hypothetical protein